MKKIMVTLALLFAMVAVHAHEQTQTEQVSVVGVGEIEAQPDMVSLSVSMFAVEPNLNAAKRVADKQYKTVLDIAKRHGVSDKEIQVTRLTMYPEYESSFKRRTYKGEKVHRSLKIDIRDLSKLSSLLQALADEEVSSVDAMNAGFQDETALRQQALAKATTKAKTKAAFLATQLDRKLGVAFNILEQSGGVQMFGGARMASQKSMSSFSAKPPEEMFGTQKIRATITVAFKLD